MRQLQRGCKKCTASVRRSCKPGTRATLQPPRVDAVADLRAASRAVEDPRSAPISLPPSPDGYELKYPGSIVDVVQVSGTGEDFAGAWSFKGKLVDASNIQVGPALGPVR